MVHLQLSFVPGVEVVAVVHRLHAPDEPERHLHAHVPLALLLEAKVGLVKDVVSGVEGWMKNKLKHDLEWVSWFS